MRRPGGRAPRWLLPVVVVALLAGAAQAQVVDTELAGNSLAQYPFFEYVKAINENATMEIAIDPLRFPGIVGRTCDVYVVADKSASEWAADDTLIDVTPGGPQAESFGGATIQANTFQVTAPSDLNADAGLGLGVGYDVVLDCDRDGALSDGDFVDGRAGEAGFYAVHDTTADGPAAVTEWDYQLTPAVAMTFGIPDTRRAENLFYPTNIASMGKRPLVVIGHGNGHQYGWYDHIGRHLASYGYVVMSHDNNTGPGPSFAATTTLGHTDAFIDQVEAGAIAGGALVGRLDTSRIVWIGHSRGAEGVAIAYDRLFDGSHTPTHFSKDDVKLISSMLPTDFRDPGEIANPRDANYQLWSAAGDTDVRGAANQDCCQTFRIHDRATHYRQSTVVQGTGHAWFHNGPENPSYFTGGPCSIGPTNDLTHGILLGHLLPLVEHYAKGNVPALDFLTRQYESFRPIGVPTGNPCIVVTHEYRNGSTVGNFMIDDYQTQTSTATGSAGGMVTFDVDNVMEGRLDDNNFDFSWTPTDPFNGAIQGQTTDTTRGVVFDWTDQDRFYEWEVPSAARDFTQYLHLSFRAAQGTQHPNTLAVLGDLTFDVTLRDGSGGSSSIDIGARGGGLEQPYDRSGGWWNEMEVIRMRMTDFQNNGSGLDLSDVVAVRLDVGPSHGSSRGRIVVDELMLTNDVPPEPFTIVEPTTARPSFAGTSVAGSRVLVRIVAGGGLDVSPANLTLAVDGVTLTPAQIPTAAMEVGGETWVVIAPGPKPDGCYDLSASLVAPSGLSDLQTASLCYADDESRELDRVLAIDQTNSMNRDGSTGIASSEKMDAARAAARFFVDLSNPNDQIGVVSFQRRDEDDDGSIVEPDELAEVEFPLTLAGEGMTDQRPAARTAVSAIEPDASPGFIGPETSPGAALVEARTMLNDDGMAGHEPNIVLVTDGLENYAPFWATSGPHGSPLRPGFAAGDVRVDTIGVGGDADDALLDDVATATGGEFRNLNEGAGSFFLLSRLSSWYKAIDEDVRGEQRFFYREGFPPAELVTEDFGELAYKRRRLRVGRFTVEPALDWMTVAFHANVDNAATVALFAPGDPTPVTASPPGVTRRADAKHSVYRIRSPQPGVWSYVVQPHDLSAEFFAVASAPTLLAARVGPGRVAQRPGGDWSVPLRVWVADTGAVVGATVAGELRRPDGAKVAVALRDDGASGDGGADDGIYGLDYVATLAGPYHVELKVAGTSNAGEPFERYLSSGFQIPGARKKPVQFGEGLPPLVPEPPEGIDGFCGCEAEARYTLAAYSGVTLPMGAFDSIADPSISLGVKPAIHFSAPGVRWSAGLYLGYDRFSNAGAGGDFDLTHLSGELELAPWTDLCPAPAVHAGVGAYRDEDGDTEVGYNLGASLGICLSRRVKLLTRYDYRSVEDLTRDYSTLQVGLRFGF